MNRKLQRRLTDKIDHKQKDLAVNMALAVGRSVKDGRLRISASPEMLVLGPNAVLFDETPF